MSQSSSHSQGVDQGLPVVSQVELRFVQDGRDGLVAWASCIVGDSIALNNIAVRRGRDGGLFLTYPARQSSSGVRHSYFHPIHREASQALLDAVLWAVQELVGDAMPQAREAAGE